MDDELRQRCEAMTRDTGDDEHLRQMFEVMSAAESPGQEVYDREMARLYERYPNQWVLYREDWDERMSELTLAVLGPFRTQVEATTHVDALSADQQAGYTLTFLQVLPANHVLIGSPVFSFAPPDAPPPEKW